MDIRFQWDTDIYQHCLAQKEEPWRQRRKEYELLRQRIELELRDQELTERGHWRPAANLVEQESRKEGELFRKEEELWTMEEELWAKEAKLCTKEAELWAKEEELRAREEALELQRQDDLVRREEEKRRLREEERMRKEREVLNLQLREEYERKRAEHEQKRAEHEKERAAYERKIVEQQRRREKETITWLHEREEAQRKRDAEMTRLQNVKDAELAEQQQRARLDKMKQQMQKERQLVIHYLQGIAGQQCRQVADDLMEQQELAEAQRRKEEPEEAIQRGKEALRQSQAVTQKAVLQWNNGRWKDPNNSSPAVAAKRAAIASSLEDDEMTRAEEQLIKAQNWW